MGSRADLTSIKSHINSALSTGKYDSAIFGDYAVDTCQVSVPCGDCSIHLLIENPPRPDQEDWNHTIQSFQTTNHGQMPTEEYVRALRRWHDTQKGTILAAVLVDGGHDGTAGSSGKRTSPFIKGTIEFIERNYTFKAPVTQLKFDSWVVTHWDRDHYCGSLYMLLEDLQSTYTREQHAHNAKPHIQSRYFKYSSSGECLTTIFCPIFDTNSWKVKPELKGAHYMLMSSEAGFVDFALYDSFESLNKKKNQSPNDIVTKVCKYKDGFQNIIGVDYFFPGDDRYQAANSRLSSLLFNLKTSSTAKQNSKRPRFLCIGAEGSIIGAPDPRLQNRLSTAGATAENFISLISIIVWPADGRISLLTAGDAHHITEDNLAKFLRDDAGVAPHIPVIKASHHGAISSTPPELLLRTKPQKIIISAGMEYGHPSEKISPLTKYTLTQTSGWPLVMFLSHYWRLLETDKDVCFHWEKPVFCLRYPYYLAANFDLDNIDGSLRTVDLNLKMLQAINGKGKSQPELDYLRNMIASYQVRNHQGLPTLAAALATELFINPPATGIHEEPDQSINPLYNKTVSVGWKFASKNFEQLLTSECLAMILTLESVENWQLYERRVWQRKGACCVWQALLIQLVSWYWTRISPIGNLWDDRVYKSNITGSRVMRYIWIRSSDHDLLDGRVNTVSKNIDKPPLTGILGPGPFQRRIAEIENLCDIATTINDEPQELDTDPSELKPFEPVVNEIADQLKQAMLNHSKIEEEIPHDDNDTGTNALIQSINDLKDFDDLDEIQKFPDELRQLPEILQAEADQMNLMGDLSEDQMQHLTSGFDLIQHAVSFFNDPQHSNSISAEAMGNFVLSLKLDTKGEEALIAENKLIEETIGARVAQRAAKRRLQVIDELRKRRANAIYNRRYNADGDLETEEPN